jgi:hypothetical protein
LLIRGDGPFGTVAGRGNGCRQGSGVDPRHGCRNSIAAPGDGLDQALLLPIPIENAAQRRDLHGQVGFLDSCSGPDRLHNLVLRDQLSLTLDEEGQERTCPRTERHWFGDTWTIKAI